jgi:hypothetical protein
MSFDCRKSDRMQLYAFRMHYQVLASKIAKFYTVFNPDKIADADEIAHEFLHRCSIEMR